MQEKQAKFGLKHLLRGAGEALESGAGREFAADAAGSSFLSGLAKSTATSYKRLAGIEPMVGTKGLQNADLLRISLPALGIGGAAVGGKALADQVEAKKATEAVFSQIKKDTDISSADTGKALELYNTLKNYAPSIAKDPLISKAFVKGMLQYGHVDHKVVNDLMTSEKIHRELKGKPFTSLQAIKEMSWLA